MGSFDKGVGSVDKCTDYPAGKQGPSTEKKDVIWFHTCRLDCWDFLISKIAF